MYKPTKLANQIKVTRMGNQYKMLIIHNGKIVHPYGIIPAEKYWSVREALRNNSKTIHRYFRNPETDQLVIVWSLNF